MFLTSQIRKLGLEQPMLVWYSIIGGILGTMIIVMDLSRFLLENFPIVFQVLQRKFFHCVHIWNFIVLFLLTFRVTLRQSHNPYQRSIFLIDTLKKLLSYWYLMKTIPDPVTLLLRFFGYEYNPKNSLLFMHMIDVTHGSWLQDLNRTNRISDYHIKH